MTDEPSWVPPADPDADAICSDARCDVLAGRHGEALAKYLWLHRNVLAIDASYDAVRLSFMIGHWFDLAQRYPPAMEAMLAERDAAEATALSGPEREQAFDDACAFNELLGERERSIGLYERLVAPCPDETPNLFQTIQTTLVQAGRFELAAKGLDPQLETQTLIACYLGSTQDQGGFAGEFFLYRVGTMIALLSHCGRWDEAERCAEQAAQVYQDPDAARFVFGKAVYGEFPADPEQRLRAKF